MSRWYRCTLSASEAEKIGLIKNESILDSVDLGFTLINGFQVRRKGADLFEFQATFQLQGFK